MNTEFIKNSIISNKYSNISFSYLKGKLIKEVQIVEDLKDGFNEGNAIVFITQDNEVIIQAHQQDCCESVYIESIVGDLQDIIGNPILVAEEVIDTIEGDTCEHYTYSFYKLDTIKGGVTIRWNGESNGYYSETVDLIKLDQKYED